MERRLERAWQLKNNRKRNGGGGLTINGEKGKKKSSEFFISCSFMLHFQRFVTPHTRTRITRTGRKVGSSRTQGNRNNYVKKNKESRVSKQEQERFHLKLDSNILMRQPTRVFMALKHELNLSSVGIPELNTAVLGSRDEPLAIRRHRNGEHKVLKMR